MRRIVASALAIMMGLGPGAGSALGQGAGQTAPSLAPTQSSASAQTVQKMGAGTFRMKVSTNIVLTNVVVRDRKTGEVVKGLKASDFHIYENKREQKIISFDYENVDHAVTLAEQTTAEGRMSVADLLNGNYVADQKMLKNHRLIVIFFDLSSMQDEDIDRAVDAAEQYVKTQMRPADLVALVSMSTGLSLDQDFTSNKTALLHALAKQGVRAGIVYVDPPYADAPAYQETLTLLASLPVLTRDARVVVEHSSHAPAPQAPAALIAYRTLRQGDAQVTFYRVASAGGENPPPV